MHLFTATFRTFDVALFVLRKCKDDFKWLLAIFTVELIARHRNLPKMPASLDFYFPCTPKKRRCQGEQSTGTVQFPFYQALSLIS
jgi:hypothetical protein